VPAADDDENAKESALTTAAETVRREEPPENSQRRQRRILWANDRPENNVLERRARQAYNITFELAGSTGEAFAKY
jgi:hypothetical protein